MHTDNFDLKIVHNNGTEHICEITCICHDTDHFAFFLLLKNNYAIFMLLLWPWYILYIEIHSFMECYDHFMQCRLLLSIHVHAMVITV